MKKVEVWVYIELSKNKILDVSLQLLSKAREIADKFSVVAVVVGGDLKLQAELALYGPDEIIFVDTKNTLISDDATMATILAQIVNKRKPNSFLFGATTAGRAIAPRLQAKLQTGLTADCLDIYFENETLVQVKPSYGDNVMCEITCPNKRPQMVTIRPDVFPKKIVGRYEPKITFLNIEIPQNSQVSLISRNELQQDGNDLSQATKIVSLGRGASKDSAVKKAKKLAKLLEAPIGVTRPLTNLPEFSRKDQIGQSGQTVKPELIFNFGIQGAAQYVSGMQTAKLIVSVNLDKNAPIFNISDYGYIGDAEEFMQELVNQLGKDD